MSRSWRSWLSPCGTCSAQSRTILRAKSTEHPSEHRLLGGLELSLPSDGCLRLWNRGVPLTVLDGKVRVGPSITISRLHDYLRAHQIEDSDPKGIQVRTKDLFKIFSKDFPVGCFSAGSPTYLRITACTLSEYLYTHIVCCFAISILPSLQDSFTNLRKGGDCDTAVRTPCYSCTHVLLVHLSSPPGVWCQGHTFCDSRHFTPDHVTFVALASVALIYKLTISKYHTHGCSLG